MIDARSLSMSYGTVQALRDATFHAVPGEVVGLLGPNGAGKTTAMRILTTYQRPTGGSATVAGFDVAQDPLEVRRRIGYLPESLPLYLAMEVRDSLAFVGRARGLRGSELKARIDWVVDRCGLDRMFHTPCLHLSKGFRQRTGLAQALLHDPAVVVLDEPTTGLDPHQILEIRSLVRELAETKTVILSTHILQEANALADRLLVMSDGHIVGSGTPSELREQAGVNASVVVALAGSGTGAAGRLSALPGAGSVEPGDGEDGRAVFSIDEVDAGLVGQVGELAHAQGWTVLELRRDPGSLEEVFLRLTHHIAQERGGLCETVDQAATGKRFEHREQPMAETIARESLVPVRRVLDPRDPMLGQKPAGLLTTVLQQWPDESAAAGCHSAEATGSGAAQEAKQDGLGLVRLRMT